MNDKSSRRERLDVASAHWYMGSTFAMSAKRQKPSSDARFRPVYIQRRVDFDARDLGLLHLMLTSFDLCGRGRDALNSLTAQGLLAVAS